MKNVTINVSKALIILTASIAFTTSAHAAGYIKFEGVDGESKFSQHQSAQQQTSQKLDNNSRPQRALLLPAVQKVREAARASESKSGKKPNRHSVGTEHEMEYDIAG